MDSIEEKRVYGDREGAATAYVASAMGIVRVRVAGDTVGEFGLCERCSARDVAAGPAAV
ncbi:HVO_0234 family beta-propeller protein, partial [Natrinema soli]|uniref:HVO_0234 family beta-propeller protein n=1 Tax=Natrinema soli TaxID=1930624 RepID=UPI003CCE2AC0